MTGAAMGRYTMRTARIGLLVMLLLSLSGCMSDGAYYRFDDGKHSVGVKRAQNWFWKKTVNLYLVVNHMPECEESLRIDDVARTARVELYQPPQEYVEPIYIAELNGTYYAASTATCRVQPFDKRPDQLGQHLGSFKEVDGHFDFVADSAVK